MGAAGAVLGWACALAAFGALGWGALVDARERRIPNAAVTAVALAALVQMTLALALPEVAVGAYGSMGLADAPSRLGWGVGSLLALSLGEALWRRARGTHGMGAGDIKLIGALALWLGPFIVAALTLACAAGAVVALVRRQRTFAFGPYLALSGGVLMVALLLM